MCKGVKDRCTKFVVGVVWSMFVGGIGESGCLVMEYGHDLAVVLRVLYVSGLTWCGG